MTTSFREVESLSAYLDGALNPADSARLEARLRSDPDLRAVMDDLRAARVVLRKLPSRRAPRRFTLTPHMAGVKPPLPRAYPALRFATALATLLLVFTFAVNSLGAVSFGASAPLPPGYGMGGGGGGDDPAAEAQQAEPAAPAEPAMAATELPVQPTLDAAADSFPVVPTPTSDMSLKIQAPDETQTRDAADLDTGASPISFSWQAVLLALVLLLGGGTWLLRFLNDHSWRGKAR